MGLESVTRISDLVATNPVVGDPVSEGDDHVRNIKTAVRTLLGFPRCSLTKSAVQAIATGSDTAVTFDQEEFDPQGMHSLVSNTERITVPAGEGGYYLINGQVRFQVGSAGTIRYMYLFKNGSHTGFTAQLPAGAVAYLLDITALLNLSVGDYIHLVAGHDAGVDQNVEHESAVPTQTRFQAIKIHD